MQRTFRQERNKSLDILDIIMLLFDFLYYGCLFCSFVLLFSFLWGETGNPVIIIKKIF